MGVKESDTIDGVKEYILDSWADFFILAKDRFAVAPAFVYRGQSNYDWPLRSSLDRLRQQFPKRKNLDGKTPEVFDRPPLFDDQHLSAFKRALRGRRGPNPPPLAEDDYWALGQDHGLATPLLDLTRSPFVALFFAFEEQKILINDTMTVPCSRGVYALSTATIQDRVKNTEKPVRLVSPDGDANFRLISQAALFAKLPPNTDVEGYVRERFKGDSHDPKYATFTKIKIPNNDRDGCLVALNKMNINHMTLFPDIDGAARHVNSLWQPGHEDSIAFV